MDVTIYDVLRALVAKAAWSSEAEQLRMSEAVKTAEEQRIFRTEGDMKL